MSANNTETVRMIANSWKVLSNDLSLTEEREYGSPQLAINAGIKESASGRVLRFLRGLGVLTYRSDYGNPSKGGGQIVWMRLNMPLDDGLKAIYRHFDAGRTYAWFEAGKPGGPAKRNFTRHTDEPVVAAKTVKADAVVVADERSPEVTRAVAGPEPESPMRAALQPLRKDELEALVEAARQYANRGDAVAAKVRELAALGVTVDETMLAKAISFEVDERLEAIASVLPYIDRIERNNRSLAAAAGSEKAELVELRRSVGVITKERNDLQAANRRLSERNVQLSAAATGAKAESTGARA